MINHESKAQQARAFIEAGTFQKSIKAVINEAPYGDGSTFRT